MNQGERCLVVHGGVEVEGVVKSHHRELDQVLVAVHKACGGYFELLRSPQDVRLVSSRPDSDEWRPADNSDTEELEEAVPERPPEEKAATGATGATPMDLDSEERATAVFLASLSAAPPPPPTTAPAPAPLISAKEPIFVGQQQSPRTAATANNNSARPGSWTDKNSAWGGLSMASRSAPGSSLVVGSLPAGHSSDLFAQARGVMQQRTAQQPPQPKEARTVEDVDTIARIMEISLNASSPPAGPPTATYRPIVYLATSPPSGQFEDVEGTTGLLLTAAPAGTMGLTAHTVSRPINIPMRRASRDPPLSGLRGSPKRAHIAHLVLSPEGTVALPASLSSSASSGAALGSVPTLGSFSPPSGAGPGPPLGASTSSSVSVGSAGAGGPLSGRRVRSDVKKCRKVYGIEHRDQWCNQCRWKKACTRFPDPTSPPTSTKHP